MPATSNRSRYQRRRATPIRANNSVRRTYDLLRSSLSALGPDTVLVEDELVDELSASRNTVRMVLQLLAKEGLVTRGPKVGTTVAASTVIALDLLMPLADMHATRPMHGRLLDHVLIPAPAVIGRRLGLAPGAPVAVIEGLLLEDATPLALTVSYVGLPGPEADTVGPDGADAIAFLEQVLEVCVARSETTVSAIACDEQTSTLLELQPGAPILWFEDLLFDAEGRPRAISQFRCRSDRVSLSLQGHRVTTAPGLTATA